MINIAVMVSGGGTNLQALIDAQESGIIKSGRITLVVSSKEGAYALTRAEKAGIPTKVISRKSFDTQEEFDRAILDTWNSARIDLVVLAGYLSILSPAVTGAYRDRIINVHPSLIPSFCGAGFYGLRVHQAALDYGVKVTGATVHIVNEIPDGGRILLQKAVEIQDGDTPEILQKRVMEEAEWKLLPRAAEMLCRSLFPLHPDREPNLLPLIEKGEEVLAALPEGDGKQFCRDTMAACRRWYGTRAKEAAEDLHIHYLDREDGLDFSCYEGEDPLSRAVYSVCLGVLSYVTAFAWKEQGWGLSQVLDSFQDCSTIDWEKEFWASFNAGYREAKQLITEKNK